MIDRNRVDDLRNVGSEFFANFYSLFKSCGQRRIEEMEAALSNDDLKTLHRLAHTFKSNGANFGANDLANLCRSIETLCESKQTLHLKKMIAELKVLFKEAIHELDDICST